MRAHPLLNFENKTALITGGTRGIGLETALVLASNGAQCILTYRWGDHDEEGILAQFKNANAKPPIMIYANVGSESDTEALLNQLKSDGINRIDIFISNAAMSKIINNLNDMNLKDFEKSLTYSSWPFVGYPLKIKAAFGHYPSYIIGISSTGPDHYTHGYDFVASTKAAMEVLCQYLNYRLGPQNVKTMILRSRFIKTQLMMDTFGKNIEKISASTLKIPDYYWVDVEDVANAAAALCSGYCDILSGRILTVDKGQCFFDNHMEIYHRYVTDNSGDLI